MAGSQGAERRKAMETSKVDCAQSVTNGEARGQNAERQWRLAFKQKRPARLKLRKPGGRTPKSNGDSPRPCSGDMRSYEARGQNAERQWRPPERLKRRTPRHGSQGAERRKAMETAQFAIEHVQALAWKPGGRTPKGNGDKPLLVEHPSAIIAKPGGRTPKGNGDTLRARR